MSLDPATNRASRGRAPHGRHRSLRRIWSVLAALGTVLVAVPVVELAADGPASASTPPPMCPPECGRIAAGDALLVPYMAPNPGPGWLALPAPQVQSYVSELRRNITRIGNGTLANVAAARWDWYDNDYGLLIVLVSSPSLPRLHLSRPVLNAQDLCAASHGRPSSQLLTVPTVPGAVGGLCSFPLGQADLGATVVAFNRANVAVLVEITSKLQTPIAAEVADEAVRQQFLALPQDGVLIPSGVDVGLIVVWLAIVAAVAVAIGAGIRRSGRWQSPFSAVADAVSRRRLALSVTLLAVAGAMFFATTESAVLHGLGAWIEPNPDDFWTSWASAAHMTFGGGYGHVYSLDSILETAPALQVVIAPVARLAFNLPFPYPGIVLYPTAFLVAGPLYLSAMALPMCGADRWMQYMGITDLRRRLAVLGVLAITLPPIAFDGHPEDMVALGAMLYGLVAAMEGRHRAVGWWLGCALAFQFLAFLAVPIAFVLLKAKRWPATIAPMVLVPLAVLAVPLIAAPGETIHRLVHQQVYVAYGHFTPTWYLDAGVGALFRTLVALASIPAALVLRRVLPANRPTATNVVVWVLGLLFGLRAFEPELVPYFLAPCLTLCVLSASSRPWWRLAATAVVATWLTAWLRVPLEGRWSLWLLLLAQLGLLGWLAFPRVRVHVPVERARREAPRVPASTSRVSRGVAPKARESLA